MVLFPFFQASLFIRVVNSGAGASKKGNLSQFQVHKVNLQGDPGEFKNHKN